MFHLLKTQFLSILRYLAVFGGLILAINCFYWAIVSNSFDLGYKVAEKEYKIEQVNKESKIRFSGDTGETTYLVLNQKYQNCGVLALIFFLLQVICIKSKGFKDLFNFENIFESILQITMLFLLMPTWVTIKWIYRVKDPNMSESLHIPYNTIVRDSANFDLMSLWIIAFLFIIEVTILCFLVFNNLKLKSTK